MMVPSRVHPVVVRERRRKVDVLNLVRRTSLEVLRKVGSRDGNKAVVRTHRSVHRRNMRWQGPPWPVRANLPTRRRRFRHVHRGRPKPASMFGKDVLACLCRLLNNARVRRDEPRTIRVLKLRKRVQECLDSGKMRVLRKVELHEDRAVINAVVRVVLVGSGDVLAHRT
jgi:hypothetical protein